MTTEKEMLECIYSDLYKDVHGFRPRGIHGTMTQKELEAECDKLSEIIMDEINAENIDDYLDREL